jgi:phospholipase/carboxylesterase
VTTTVILLHGRGRDAADVLTLAHRMQLGTAAAVIAPDAPERTWYPQSFLAPFADNEPYLSEALATVDELVRGAPDPSRLVLGGFSQGACLAAEYALRNPRRYGGLLLFTGGYIGPPGWFPARSGSFLGTPVFMGVADPDDWVPVWRVHETASVLGALGASVDMRVYAGMDHLVNDEEIALARELIVRVAA